MLSKGATSAAGYAKEFTSQTGTKAAELSGSMSAKVGGNTEKIKEKLKFWTLYCWTSQNFKDVRKIPQNSNVNQMLDLSNDYKS